MWITPLPAPEKWEKGHICLQFAKKYAKIKGRFWEGRRWLPEKRQDSCLSPVYPPQIPLLSPEGRGQKPKQIKGFWHLSPYPPGLLLLLKIYILLLPSGIGRAAPAKGVDDMHFRIQTDEINYGLGMVTRAISPRPIKQAYDGVTTGCSSPAPTGRLPSRPGSARSWRRMAARCCPPAFSMK